ncbi:hypothetical protein LMH87_010697 [Akanthomyces muscarius]|uniref:Uncharacterized protein n=1 Tax=Akanthomyces muscarius TaxID=2231603 RepID=A0A9W8QB07_AKAMU|nr:hypothetical protein LMH87_010697 [Akanthomyces muscarius]KAJ4149923.1 hypothetical protein LMH87_010697 [Akanthomyces muscarius]
MGVIDSGGVLSLLQSSVAAAGGIACLKTSYHRPNICDTVKAIAWFPISDFESVVPWAARVSNRPNGASSSNIGTALKKANQWHALNLKYLSIGTASMQTNNDGLRHCLKLDDFIVQLHAMVCLVRLVVDNEA